MALVLADRVKETTTTTGTGTVTLLGASTGFQSFAAVGNGNTTYYTIAGQTTSEWEVGIGTYTAAGTTLSRTTVLASSNAGSLVTFSAGTKDVFVTYPSSRSVYADGTTLTATNSSVLPATSGGTGQSSYAIGDLLYASTTTALSKLADVATGNALISGGVNTAPSWGKIGLTTHVSGTLPVANGGTGNTTNTATYLSSTAQTNLIVGYASTATNVNTANDLGSFSCRSDGTASTVASMSFHRPGLYAINMGLSASNTFIIGGWSASSNAFVMDGSGNLSMLGSVSGSSDESLKTNWRELPTDFIEQLAKVKHGTYDRIDIEVTQDGVSAQSLQPVLPNSVLTGEDGKLSVAYGNAALVAAIKLAGRVVELEAKLEQLIKDKS